MIFKNNKVYDILKWSVLIAIPATATAYTQLANILGWAYGREVAEASAIICTLLGTLLGISNRAYYNQLPEQDPAADPEQDLEVEESSDQGGLG